MTETEITKHILDSFPRVETTENLGYTFFFYDADHMLPFATIATADNEYERVSNHLRPGNFRLNIGVGRQTFQLLFGTAKVDVSQFDYATLDRILPHPDYAAQNFICVLNPSAETFEQVKPFLAEPYEIARVRNIKRAKSK